MIVDALVWVIAGLVSSIGDLLTGMFPAVPGWATDAADKVSQLLGVLYTLNSWLPVSLVMTVVTAVVAAYGVSLVIGVVRLVASYLTLGGGAT